MAYTLLEGIEWEALNGQRVTVEVSANWIVFGLPDKTLLKIAKAKRPGHRKTVEGGRATIAMEEVTPEQASAYLASGQPGPDGMGGEG
jgi:hypothetical protein